MGYTEDPAMVRVDFFKESGKYYTTEAVKWTGEWEAKKQDIHSAFKQSLCDHLGTRLKEMDAVCLHPYHQNKFPLCVRKGGWLE